MAIPALEGIVENGQIRLPDEVVFPEHTEVTVVVPVLENARPARVDSRRLVHPARVADFAALVIEVPPDAVP